MSLPFVDLKAQHDSIRAEIDAAVREVIDGGQFILGPQVEALEKEVSAYCGTRFGIGCGSGTDALLAALMAAGVERGDEVITTPFTFVATAEAIAFLGAKPVFADIDPATFNSDPKAIESRISPRTTAIVVVHLYGLAADMDPILSLAREHNLQVIEDAAQAIGAEYHGRRVGSFGTAGCLSFYPAKNLGAFGDAGMIVTGDEALAVRLRMIRAHGARQTYRHEILGFNGRLDTLQAAILLVKLRHLETWQAARRRASDAYRERLKGLDLVLPEEPAGRRHVYHQFTIRVKARDALGRHLAEQGIPAAVHYPMPLHLQEVFRYLGYRQDDFPEAEQASREVLSLPIGPCITEERLDRISEGIRSFLTG